MKKKEPKIIKISDNDLTDLQKKIKNSNLSEKEKSILINLLNIYIWLSALYFSKKLSLKKIKRLFSFSTEKSNKKDEKNEKDKKDKKDKKDDDNNTEGNSKEGGKGSGEKGNNSESSGHGRNGHKDLPGAKQIIHGLDNLNKGEQCPDCELGKLYPVEPGKFIQFTGQSPINCIVHKTEKLRCNRCGKIFEAKLPQDLIKQKYDESCDVALAIQRYGLGIPHYRLSHWQKDLGIPLAASTQWERVEELGTSCYPVFEYLKKYAGGGCFYQIDDTGNRILDLTKSIKANNAKRKGIYTTGIISIIENRVIKLFFTGNRHAGENFSNLLGERKSSNDIILMSDALARNCPKSFKGIWANCLTHSRRGFYDFFNKKEKIDKTVGHIIHLFGKIYRYDKISSEKGHTADERLIYHQKKSGIIIKKIRRWCLKMFYLKKIEPNEELGEAIKYFLNHYKKLTEFLRIAGIPLDNTAVERLLKSSIMHRKNSLFYKTELGAYIGDMMMSLIMTTRETKVNVFDYLVKIHKNRDNVKTFPEKWMPWNYQLNLHPDPI